MATRLMIRDGDPSWWNSPDIWVVPGNDPTGAPGVPVAGAPAYLWSRTHNTGDQSVVGARVDFYWSNPATGVLRSTSHLVGSAYVDLEPGEVQEVLCLTPWLPEIVNNGHECLVAEIIHAADPLPSPLADQFDPANHRQIAQRNLTVLASAQAMLVRAVQVGAPKREKRAVTVYLEIGGKIDELSLAQLGLKGFRPGAPGKGFEPLLSLLDGCDGAGERTVDIELAPGERRAVYLKVPPAQIDKGEYVAIHVVADNGGGVTFLLTGEKEG